MLLALPGKEEVGRMNASMTLGILQKFWLAPLLVHTLVRFISRAQVCKYDNVFSRKLGPGLWCIHLVQFISRVPVPGAKLLYPHTAQPGLTNTNLKHTSV